ncbi:hypothetical protein Ahy_B06g081267 isoform C [Arachis hypogaea]|uniref:Uncharacterized protein n=1 Tax=Arachis hypogaea TaxID=3818 RepID=A0A444YKL1_ARAHY|nr:hypothetical protein Ahy_B06g081267 isoform C [Arachis hypogaea]
MRKHHEEPNAPMKKSESAAMRKLTSGSSSTSTCISVESQMLLRFGKCLLILSARCMYSSNSTTFISHALSPILTCMLRRGLGTHGL